MKNLRKVLSLILVVAMAASFMVFASAKDYKTFTDKADIGEEYLEAVDLVSALEIFAGDNTGALNPKGYFTRAQAAKIVTYMSIGASAAERLVPTGGIFTDVPASHWGSKYIAYAYEKSILGGDGDGKFRPDDYVTGAEVAKLMNTVLGYGKMGEYTGASWQLNAISDGVSRGLISGEADLSAPALREEVIQYVFNTIRPNGYSYAENGAVLGPLGMNAMVEYSSIIGSYVVSGTTAYGGGGGVTGKTYIGEYVFGLQAISFDDASGRPMHYWKVGAKQLTDNYLSQKPDYTSTGGTWIYTREAGLTAYDLETANKLSFARYLDIFYNGQKNELDARTLEELFAQLEPKLPEDAEEDAEAPLNFNNVTLKKGVLIEIYLNGNGEVYRIVLIEKAVAEVLAAPTVSYGTVTGIPGVTSSSGDTFAGELDLVKGDIVLYYEDINSVIHVEKATAVEGQLTKYTTSALGDTVTFGGKAYGLTGLSGVKSTFRNRTELKDLANYNIDSVAFLDNSGSLCWFKPGEGITTNYVYLLQAGNGSGFADGIADRARLVGIDGTYFTANIKAAPGAENVIRATAPATVVNGTPVPAVDDSGWYRFSVNDSNVYTLTRVAESKTKTITAGTAQPLENKPTFISGEKAGNGSTIFLIADNTFATSGSIKKVTGVANLPSSTKLALEAGDKYAIVYGTDGYARYVFINTADTLSGTENTMFIPQIGSYDIESNDYVTFASVMINGEKKSNVKIAFPLPKAVKAGGLYTVTLSGDVYTIVAKAPNTRTGATLTTGTNALVDKTEYEGADIPSAVAFNVSPSAVIIELTSSGSMNEVALDTINTYNITAEAKGDTQYYNYWFVTDTNGTITQLYFQKTSTGYEFTTFVIPAELEDAMSLGTWPLAAGMYDPNLNDVGIPAGAKVFGLYTSSYENIAFPDAIEDYEEVDDIEDLVEAGQYYTCVVNTFNYVILMPIGGAGEPEPEPTDEKLVEDAVDAYKDDIGIVIDAEAAVFNFENQEMDPLENIAIDISTGGNKVDFLEEIERIINGYLEFGLLSDVRVTAAFKTTNPPEAGDEEVDVTLKFELNDAIATLDIVVTNVEVYDAVADAADILIGLASAAINGESYVAQDNNDIPDAFEEDADEDDFASEVYYFLVDKFATELTDLDIFVAVSGFDVGDSEVTLEVEIFSDVPGSTPQSATITITGVVVTPAI